MYRKTSFFWLKTCRIRNKIKGGIKLNEPSIYNVNRNLVHSNRFKSIFHKKKGQANLRSFVSLSCRRIGCPCVWNCLSDWFYSGRIVFKRWMQMIRIFSILTVSAIAILALIWWKKNSSEDFKCYAIYVCIVYVLYLATQVLYIIGSE